jgi:hypothetical protein
VGQGRNSVPIVYIMKEEKRLRTTWRYKLGERTRKFNLFQTTGFWVLTSCILIVWLSLIEANTIDEIFVLWPRQSGYVYEL